ncbi:hypothetical protein B1R27_14535 [Streptomyces sp. GKU 895]|nr:hypothetical protein B1R27_14535 [Streptomyces sp. GKU 895]
MPSGTRHASTHTVHVRSFRAPPSTGAGSPTSDSTVAQSTPSAPMMCVPNRTVPERTAVPPELWKTSVTSSHHRRSVAARTGASQPRAAGAVVRLGDGVWDGEPDAVRPDLVPRDGRALGAGSSGAAGELIVCAGELPTCGPGAPLSSGTTRTLPVGFPGEGVPPAGPTAV